MSEVEKNIPLRAASVVSIAIFFLAASLIMAAIKENKAPFELMWAIPIAIGLFRIFDTMMVVDAPYNPPAWLFVVLFYAACGAWAAFALESISILSKWYAHPDQSGLEPLFTSTGLCAAVCAWLQSSYRGSLRKIKRQTELWHE